MSLISEIGYTMIWTQLWRGVVEIITLSTLNIETPMILTSLMQVIFMAPINPGHRSRLTRLDDDLDMSWSKV